jgi:hypothetical protein
MATDSRILDFALASDLIGMIFMEWHHILVRTDIVSIVTQWPDTSITETIISQFDLDLRSWRSYPILFGPSTTSSGRRQTLVQERDVRGIEPTFQRLKPVALLPRFQYVSVAFWPQRPLKFWK